MKTSEVITKLKELIDKEGDRDFNIYKSFSKETTNNIDVFFDDLKNDICIGIYA